MITVEAVAGLNARLIPVTRAPSSTHALFRTSAKPRVRLLTGTAVLGCSAVDGAVCSSDSLCRGVMARVPQYLCCSCMRCGVPKCPAMVSADLWDGHRRCGVVEGRDGSNSVDWRSRVEGGPTVPLAPKTTRGAGLAPGTPAGGSEPLSESMSRPWRWRRGATDQTDTPHPQPACSSLPGGGRHT